MLFVFIIKLIWHNLIIPYQAMVHTCMYDVLGVLNRNCNCKNRNKTMNNTQRFPLDADAFCVPNTWLILSMILYFKVLFNHLLTLVSVWYCLKCNVFFFHILLYLFKLNCNLSVYQKETFLFYFWFQSSYENNLDIIN